MSDKPLAEKWCEESKRCKQIADECGDDSVFAQSVRYWMCADELKKFAAEHLTEQTEPSAGLRAWTLNVISASDFDGAPTTEEAAEILARKIFDLIEQGRRRIRELLVGKERP